MESDKQLVKATLNGDRQAYAELIKRYEKPVKVICCRILCDMHLADDASQEAFIKGYFKLRKLKKTSKFGPWIFQTARNTALDILRRQKNSIQREQSLHEIHFKNNGILDREQKKLLTAVSALPDEDKQLIALRFFEGACVDEVAKIIGKSPSTVRNYTQRAMEKIKKSMAELSN